MKKPTKKTIPKKGGTTSAPIAMPAGEDMKWKAQDALHTLRRAHEIQSDPKLMEHVQHHARGEREHLNKIIRRKVK